MQKQQFTLPKDKIEKFCRKHHIRRLSLFGSILSGTRREDSDVDILVEFDDGHIPGLKFFSMQEELSSMLDCSVDLNTPSFLSRYFRDEVMRIAKVCYER